MTTAAAHVVLNRLQNRSGAGQAALPQFSLKCADFPPKKARGAKVVAV